MPNRTIFTGDNLDILRGVNSECIDLIYLDPPFKSDQLYTAPPDSEARGADFYDVWTLDDMKQEWVDEIEYRRPSLYHLISAAKLVSGESMAGYLTFMSVRLLELHRVLKDNGSIYLHCDPSASHYLKGVMDAIFGPAHFQNEIIWKRTGSHGGARRWGPIHDTILFYSSSSRHKWNRAYQSYTPDYLRDYYRYEDERGKYQLVSLTGAGTTKGDSGMAWRGVNPAHSGRHWAVPQSALRNAYPERTDWNELGTQEKLDLLDHAGLVYWPPKGRTPRQKRYADEGPGVPIQDIITDIRPIGAHARERTGWRTQKPLALLERIIQASSDPGDTLLDPFCGCATACIAAEKLGRQWIAIDKAPQAVTILKSRAVRELPTLMPETESRNWEDWIPAALTAAPQRTDSSPANLPPDKELLYHRQKGKCQGCRYHLPVHALIIDHITPRPRHGPDAADSRQLLCHACHAIKGSRSMEYLKKELGRRGILTAGA